MAQASGLFKIGVATVDITPPIGATLIGYSSRVSTRIDTPLKAECLYCENPTGKWLLISGEFIGMYRSTTDALRAEIATRTGVPAEAIMIAATHRIRGNPKPS